METGQETDLCFPLHVINEHSGLGFSLLHTGLGNGLGLDSVFFSFIRVSMLELHSSRPIKSQSQEL